MELKTSNGMVPFVLIVDGARVENKMTEREAKGLILSGKLKKQGNKVYVDDKFVFDLEGEEAEETKEAKAETTTEAKAETKKKTEKKAEAKAEDIPLKEAVKKSSKKPRKKKIMDCQETRCIQEPCASLKNGFCKALKRTTFPCKFYKPKSQWDRELEAMNKRCSRTGIGWNNEPWSSDV